MSDDPKGAPDTAMIVAGGRGTRLLPFTRITPKPMLPFCGAPFLAGVARRLATQGVRRVLLVVGADPTAFEPLVALLRPHGVDVSMVPEPTPLDTAGGVRLASLDVDRAFYVLNGDILTDLELAPLVAHHRREGAQATIALTRVEDTSAFGVCVRDGGRITDFVEKPAPGTLAGQDCINAGTYLLEPGVLEAFPTGPLSFERTVFPGLLAQGAVVAGHVAEGVWSDLGTPERFLAGQRLVLDGGVAWPPLDELAVDVASRVHVAVGARIDPAAVLEGPVVIGADVRIAAGAQVGPHTVLAEGVEVAQGARVVGSLVDAGTRIDERALVDSALVGSRAHVCSDAELAPLSVLGPEAEIAAGGRLAAGARLPDPAA
jgi:NDP-sugar pyrophosphorylase family protein